MLQRSAIHLTKMQVIALIAGITFAFCLMVAALFFLKFGGVNRLHDGQVPDVVAETLSVAVSGSTTSFPNVKIKQQMSFVNEHNALCKHYFYQTQAQNMQAIACFENGKWINAVTENVEGDNFGELFAVKDDETSKVAKLMHSKFLDAPLSQQQERERLHSLHKD
ncbi:hypothetical protein TDB9533_01722 [Thalassocella blandensis]|nr:hypothetical protein TDB9533_01722 [Thalassocella blandensis]